MSVAPDDQVVVHRHAERLGDLDDVFGDGDVRLRRGGSPEGWLCTTTEHSVDGGGQCPPTLMVSKVLGSFPNTGDTRQNPTAAVGKPPQG